MEATHHGLGEKKYGALSMHLPLTSLSLMNSVSFQPQFLYQ